MLIVSTSANIQSLPSVLKKMRDNEYLQCISWLNKNVQREKVIFLECFATSSFIEEFYPVYYSNTHNPDYQNIGANLGLALRNFLESYDTDESLICQITGRYLFQDRYFLDTVEQNPGYDFYGKDVGGQYFTGCFAMKKHYFIDWVNKTDWDELNYKMINFEKSIFDYVQSNNLKTYHFDSLHMSCNVFGKGNPCKIEV
jgi:hypothetical protein